MRCSGDLHPRALMFRALYVSMNKYWVFSTPTAAASEERRFFSFHEWGISVYEPSACRLYHRIQSTDIIPGTQVSIDVTQ